MGGCLSKNKTQNKTRKISKSVDAPGIVSTNDPPVPIDRSKLVDRKSTAQNGQFASKPESKNTVMRMRVLNDYTFTSEREKIVIKQNDIVTILDNEDSDKILVQTKNGKKAEIPEWLLTKHLSPPPFDDPWYFHEADRDMSIRMLIQVGEVGAFLIRPSTSYENKFSLSILYPGQVVKHRLVSFLGGNYTVNDDRSFSSMKELVEYYMTHENFMDIKLTNPPGKATPTILSLEDDAWELNRADIELRCKVGRGEFGDVFKGLYKDKTVVAVKKLKEAVEEAEMFLSEANVMKKLKHPRLVNLLGVVSRTKPYFIVTEFVHHGSLLQFLRKNVDLTGEVLIGFCLQIAEGMKFLEEKNVIHRDLAARNVLVNEHLYCKLADFGMAVALGSHEDTANKEKDAKIPIRWCSPEVLKYGKFSVKSDVWAYAVVCIEIFLYGQRPYDQLKNAEVTTFVLTRKVHLKPGNMPEEMYSIVTMCFQYDPNDRPTFAYTLDRISDLSVACADLYK